MQEFNLDSFFKYASSSIVQRGVSYHRQKRVKFISIDEKSAKAQVRGSNFSPYTVLMQFDQPAKPYPFSITCTCPHAHGMPMLLCKHKVAALLQLRDDNKDHPSVDWRRILKSTASTISPSMSNQSNELLFFSIQNQFGMWYISPYSLPVTHFDIVSLSDIKETHAVIAENELSFHAKAVRDRRNINRYINAAPLHITALNLILDWDKYGYMMGKTLESVLPMLAGSYIYKGKGVDPLAEPVSIERERPRFEVDISRIDNTIRVSGLLIFESGEMPVTPGCAIPICERPKWLMTDSMVFQVDSSTLLDSLLLEEIVIAKEDEEDFLKHYLPDLAERFNIRGNVFSGWLDIKSQPIPRIYISEEGDELVSELRFAYGDHEVTQDNSYSFTNVQMSDDGVTLVRINRNMDMEKLYSKSVAMSYGLRKGSDAGTFTLRSNTTPIDFIYRHIPKLMEDGFEIYGEDKLAKYKVNRNSPKLSVNVSSGIDWFDLDIEITFGKEKVSLADFRKTFRKRTNYIKLSDGSTGMIPEEWFEKYKHLFGLSDAHDGNLRMSASQITLIDSILSEVDSKKVDREFKERCKQLRNFKGIGKKKLPSGFTGELRGYQKAGYEWLHFLHDFGFGGCLADDMGVGKTIQTLVFLQSLRENGHTDTADIIVMPKSLLANWEREAQRFTPNLRIYIHSGLTRLTDPSEFNNYDLILTTYGIMRRDIEILRSYKFHYAILDESQAIKNPVSATGKAARCLNCSHQLVLTGTPVENNTTDLWSQFAFLNPGLLGSHDYFRREFAGSIERDKDTNSARYLRSVVHPFILRRTKEQVAPELPPRTERIIYCEMDSHQLRIYNRWKDRYRAMLLGELEDKGMQNVRMKILEGLLRLRQICIHPALVDSDFKGSSAKMDVLAETIETLCSEGHKALIFSQFTSALKLVADELRRQKIPYAYLDGRTKDRQEQVDKFQNNPSIPIFLISLKAGGVGLNLTAADYVIHLDPWWNPAVERQASDRTHRIGQDKPVFIHKFIAKGSVEEKILTLQESKRELADQIITTESNLIKSLTPDDIRGLFS